MGSLVVVGGLSCSVAYRILPRHPTHVPCIARWILNHWAPRAFPCLLIWGCFYPLWGPHCGPSPGTLVFVSPPLILPSLPPPFLAALLWELNSSPLWRNNQESHRRQSKEMGGHYSRSPRPLSQRPHENPSSFCTSFIHQALNSFDSAFRGHRDRSWGTLETTLGEVAARAPALSN